MFQILSTTLLSFSYFHNSHNLLGILIDSIPVTEMEILAAYAKLREVVVWNIYIYLTLYSLNEFYSRINFFLSQYDVLVITPICLKLIYIFFNCFFKINIKNLHAKLLMLCC